MACLMVCVMANASWVISLPYLGIVPKETRGMDDEIGVIAIATILFLPSARVGSTRWLSKLMCAVRCKEEVSLSSSNENPRPGNAS